MHWVMILGIALIAIGTFLTYLGSNYQSNKVSEEIKDKIQLTNDKIEALKKEPNVTKEDINKIDEEFSLWASDFIKNKDSYKLKLKKENLDIQSEIIVLSQKWFTLYDYFFTTLKKMINAYNETSPNKIITKIPSLPANLYSPESNEFIAKVKFSNDMIWIIQLQDRLQVEDVSLPSIEIDIEKGELFNKEIKPNKDFIHQGKLSIKPDVNLSKIRIERIDGFKTKELQSEYDLNNYKNSIKQILDIIVRYQLINT